MDDPRGKASGDAVPDDQALRRVIASPRWAVIGIFILLFVGALAMARTFLTPSVLGFLLALVFSPVRRALERLGLPSVLGAFVITGTLLAVFVSGVTALSGPATQWMQDAQVIGRQIEWKLRDLRDLATQVQDAAQQLDGIAEGGAADEEVQRVVVEGSGVASTVAVSAPSFVAQVVFTLVLLFFLLASGDMFYEKIVHSLPTFADKRRALRIAHDIERKLSQYLFTITAINAGLGLAIGLAMWLLGMPNPVLFGVIGFLLNFIPYLGSLAGVALVGVVGLVSLPTAWDALVPALAYFGLTALEGQLITPYLVGRNLRLNTVVVFLSVAFWAWLWSVVGMLLATPLLVTIRVLCEHIPALNAVGMFLSARGAEREEEDAPDEKDAPDPDEALLVEEIAPSPSPRGSARNPPA